VSNIVKKLLKKIKIHQYIFFDLFNILIFIFVVNLYEEIEIWFYSYFFVYLIFCFAIFLKQYDPNYLDGLDYHKDEGVFEWILIFGIMLFPGWLAGPALLDMIGIPADIEVSYTVLVSPLMLIYPIIFGFFPFRKVLKGKYKKLKPLSKGWMLLLTIFSNLVIYTISIYLQVFYFDIIRIVFADKNIETMDLIRRIVTFAVSMIAFAIIYFPARIHFFFQFHGKLANKISFAITVALIAIYTMTGIDVF